MRTPRRLSTLLLACAIALAPFSAAGTAGQADAAADAGLFLYPLPSVQQDKIKLRFDYRAAKAGTYRVTLRVKPAGQAAYQAGTLDKTVIKAVSAGLATYQVTWNRIADKLKAGERADLQLVATDAKGKTETFELRGYRPDSKPNVRGRIDNYLIYYGAWTDALVNRVKDQYKLVILDTRAGITPRQVARLRAGKDPRRADDDVLVLGYLSAGEDSRTIGLTPAQMKKDKRFVLDGTGPAVDPRLGAPYPNGGPLTGPIDSDGKLTGGGFAPFYLNDNFATNGKGARGVPDFNANFNGAFVNIGHPLWYAALSNMTLKQDKVSGIRELLGTDYGGAYGLDGLFLDTLDTAAPNSYTDASSWNQSEFEWTAPGTRAFVEKLSRQYPSALLAANRGLFFYNPDLGSYAHTLRPYVDFVMFESFRLNNSDSEYFNATFFADNKYNAAQKLLAEADRPDGFRALSLGYAEGPAGAQLRQALRRPPTASAPRMLTDDIDEAAVRLGMVHYLSTRLLIDVNTFVKDYMPAKAQKPVWGSTKTPPFGQPFEAAREGAQAAFFEGGKLVVQWDLAHSQARPIRYTLYVKEGTPFDMTRDLKQQSVAAYVETVRPDVPSDYAGAGDRSARYPYQTSVGGLDPNKTYQVLIRARNAQGLYETNTHAVQVNGEPSNS
ncbi:hypothetical protein [Paenibacillus methanolicus]|uniref:Fibronectin type-III domain-containing protein n=1 Tax=Paenibacillus methanolicus TaxID=582686 RepID=A0A5S5C695_9BACL|nr:hypothetical protein [Paenibacillus methanolicus]TYP74837.1 hypothetical protein BCM02_105384 [Paenibacillus methanolicus]